MEWVAEESRLERLSFAETSPGHAQPSFNAAVCVTASGEGASMQVPSEARSNTVAAFRSARRSPTKVSSSKPASSRLPTHANSAAARMGPFAAADMTPLLFSEQGEIIPS